MQESMSVLIKHAEAAKVRHKMNKVCLQLAIGLGIVLSCISLSRKRDLSVTRREGG